MYPGTASQRNFMQRFMAIDNVCAWPSLVRLPGGSVLAIIFNQPTHGVWEGDVECWISTDDGHNWSKHGVPAPHEPGTNRMNVAAGMANDGAVVVLVSGWGSRPPRGVNRHPGFDSTMLLPCWVCRSSDAGRTWTRTTSFAPPPGAATAIPYGKIVTLPDGTLGVTAGVVRVEDVQREDQAWFYRSRDDGRTWGEPTLISTGSNETDLLPATDGRLLAASRSQAGGHLDLFLSDDAGHTWTFGRQLTGDGEHPAHLLLRRDGTIVLTYSIRHRGFFGIGARLSANAGRDWYSPATVLSFDDAFDGGYPSTVELDDGRLLTAYYASGIDAHHRYHMGVVIWRTDDIMNRNQPRPHTF